jgi:hypothetical protein
MFQILFLVFIFGGDVLPHDRPAAEEAKGTPEDAAGTFAREMKS